MVSNQVSNTCPLPRVACDIRDMVNTGEAGAVASEPRLFVGQIPVDATVEDLAQLFAPFAARGLRSLNLVKRPDGVSKGCAMVVFERWAEGAAL